MISSAALRLTLATAGIFDVIRPTFGKLLLTPMTVSALQHASTFDGLRVSLTDACGHKLFVMSDQPSKGFSRRTRRRESNRAQPHESVMARPNDGLQSLLTERPQLGLC